MEETKQTLPSVSHWALFGISLLIMAYGVAFSVKSALGTSPISSVPYAISLFTPFTIGNVTIFMHLVLIGLQVLILRKRYPLIQLVQLPVAIAFGFMTDFSLWTLRSIDYTNYGSQWLFCIIGILLVAFGVSGEVASGATVLAGEGFILAVCTVNPKVTFSRMKVTFDISLVVISVVLSLIFTQKIGGVREGTAAAMICVGLLTKVFAKPWEKISGVICAEPENAVAYGADA